MMTSAAREGVTGRGMLAGALGETDDLTPGFLIRSFRRRRVGQRPLTTQLRAPLAGSAARIGLAVESLGFGRGTATCGEPQHHDLESLMATGDVEQILGLEPMGGFHTLAVHVHLADRKSVV